MRNTTEGQDLAASVQCVLEENYFVLLNFVQKQTHMRAVSWLAVWRIFRQGDPAGVGGSRMQVSQTDREGTALSYNRGDFSRENRGLVSAFEWNLVRARLKIEVFWLTLDGRT